LLVCDFREFPVGSYQRTYLQVRDERRVESWDDNYKVCAQYEIDQEERQRGELSFIDSFTFIYQN